MDSTIDLDLFKLDEHVRKELEKNNGCFITEYVVPRDQAIEWMKKYHKPNKEE